MRYNPALDGLRALAVLLVLAFHARIEGFHGGFFGVDVFFVLSGYLITRLLADQHSATGTINVPAFYLRRLRRLYPALLLFLGVYLIAGPLAFPNRQDHARDALVAATYLSDYGFAFWKIPWVVQHTWSLSVEEHFYLAWPVALLLVLRLPRRYWAPMVLSLAAAATLWRWHVVFNVDPWQQPYYRFDTRLSGLLLGAAAGLWKPQVPRLAAPLGGALLLLAMSQAYTKVDTALTVWMAVAEVGSLLLVLGAHQVRLLAWAPLVWIGKLSYGIYLWHYPIMLWLRGHDVTGLECLAIGGGGAFLGAALSYFTVERFARSRRAHDVEAAGGRQVGALGRDPGIR